MRDGRRVEAGGTGLLAWLPSTDRAVTVQATSAVIALVCQRRKEDRQLSMKEIAERVGELLDLVGVLIIAVGVVIATVVFVYRYVRVRELIVVYPQFRQGVGRAILLGLEFLVAGDIIRTVAVSPTFQSVGVLALIVAVRTFLSISLEVELEGRWPWQARARTATGRAPAAGSGRAQPAAE